MSGTKPRGQSTNGQASNEVLTNEVEVRPQGRRYSRAYKLKILAEAEQCKRGEVGALLRREGLYSSTLSRWREERAAGKLRSGGQRKGGIEKQEMAGLRRENARLKAKLAQAEAVIEVQKKLAALLEQVDSSDRMSQSR